MDAADLPGAGLVTPSRTTEDARSALAAVVDPEIPVLTISDLGILRDVTVVGDAVTVTITPTYSGCPAMDLIRTQIVDVLRRSGFEPVLVETVFDPPWTTDWMTDEARSKLAGIGIAPPRQDAAALPEPVLCPQCGGDDVKTLSAFGSTACKSLLVCSDCGEPFDLFKAI